MKNRKTVMGIIVMLLAFAAFMPFSSASAATKVTWGKPGVWAVYNNAYVAVRANAPSTVTWTGAQGNIYDANKKRITLCHENFKIKRSSILVNYDVKKEMTNPSTGKTVKLKAGKVYYVKFQVKTGGKWYSTGMIKFKVKTPEQRARQFQLHKYWKDDLPWGWYQKPKYNTKSGRDPIGCAAYAYDFYKYMYGKADIHKKSDRKKYTKASSIRAGDIIHLKSGYAGHWFVVLGVLDNGKIKSAEGNAWNGHSKTSGKTFLTASKYYIKNGKLKGCGYQEDDNGKKYTLSFDYGYRYYW